MKLLASLYWYMGIEIITVIALTVMYALIATKKLAPVETRTDKDRQETSLYLTIIFFPLIALFYLWRFHMMGYSKYGDRDWVTYTYTAVILACVGYMIWYFIWCYKNGHVQPDYSDPKRKGFFAAVSIVYGIVIFDFILFFIPFWRSKLPSLYGKEQKAYWVDRFGTTKS